MATRKTSTAKETLEQSVSVEKDAIKYADKSKDQPELIPVFNAITTLMAPFKKGLVEVNNSRAGMYNMVVRKPVEIAGRKLDELFFASALIQKGYVGFYYFPIYVAPDLKSQLGPSLIKCLKGKTCFHIKNLQPEILQQIQKALELGYKMYEERGWI